MATVTVMYGARVYLFFFGLSQEGIFIEEPDLLALFGEQYQYFRRRIPIIIPIPKRG